MAGLVARDIRIGGYQFEMVGDHQISEENLGPIGQIDLTMADWSGGLSPITDGIFYRQKPMVLSSKGADTAFPSQVICQPSATTITVMSGAAMPTGPIRQVDFGTSTYLGSGRYVYAFNGTGGWAQVLDAGSSFGVTDIAVSQSKIGAAVSASFQYSSNGTVWTNASLAADRWGVINDKLYRAVRPNTVFATTGGFNGSWDSGSSIADSSYNINSLIGVEQVLIIGKEDGAYSIDYQGYVVPFTPELRTQATSVMAALGAAATFNGDYFMRTFNGMISISNIDGAKRRVGIDTLASPDLVTPQVKNICSDDRYLYALLANTSNGLTILRRTIAGAWHVYYYDPNAGAGQHLAVSGVMGYPALFFSYNSGGSSYVTKMIRLSQFPNPIQDPNYTYDTANVVRMRLPRIGSAQAQEVIDRLIVQSLNLSANVKITPYYSVDGGSITQFGAAAITTSPSQVVIPATAVLGSYVDLYLDLQTNDTTKTPILQGLSWKGAWQSPRRQTDTYYINLNKDHVTRRGGRVLKGEVAVIADLNALRNTTSYLSCFDEDGQPFQALVQETSIVQARSLDPSIVRDNPEMAGNVGRIILWRQPTT